MNQQDQSSQPIPIAPTQAELDAMPPFERFKWTTRHILSPPKDAISKPFTVHQKTTPNKPPHAAE